MNSIYMLCGISKQGHAQALKRAEVLRHKTFLYLGFIEEVRRIHPGMGLRLMYEQFRPEGIGRDSFIAMGLYHGYRLRALSHPQKTTYSLKTSRYPNLLEGRKFTNVNQIWSSDLFYFPIGAKHYYVVLIMDVYSRRIIGYHGSDNMRAENNIRALNMALNLRGIANYENELIHHSDRGSQYISNNYTNILDDYQIRISMCTDVLENSHMERANGTIKNDYLNRWDIQCGQDLPNWLNKAINGYNNRSHKSLMRKTPIEFETYINELCEKDRPVLEIFTIKNSNRISENPNQLCLFPGL